MSTLWSRQTMKQVKGNHRRTNYVGRCSSWGYEEYS